MRHCITLCESMRIPSFIDQITDDLIAEIIATGKWVSHGSELSYSWINGLFDDAITALHPNFINKSFDEVQHTQEFKDILRHTIRRIAKQHLDILVNGSKYDHLPPFGPESPIYRGISSDHTTGKFGVYWSQVEMQSLGLFIDQAHGGILLVAKAKDVTIDWYQTFRSRIDLGNGMDELEIQLVPGTPVKATQYAVSYDRSGVPSKTLLGPITGTA